jgi:hypothetical protein
VSFRKLKNLQDQYDALKEQYRLLRSAKWQPAQCDGPWQARFAELDTEYTKMAKENSALVLENAELKVQVSALLKLLEQK